MFFLISLKISQRKRLCQRDQSFSVLVLVELSKGAAQIRAAGMITAFNVAIDSSVSPLILRVLLFLFLLRWEMFAHTAC